MNEAKQLGALLRALSLLGDDVHVALVGRRIEGFDVDDLVARSGLGGRARVAADVEDAEFLGWIAAADVVVDLRFPHRGEVSGSLMRAMQVGRPAVVSATGSYLDIPQDQVLRVSRGPVDHEELAERLRSLVDNPEAARSMGERARAYVREIARSEATANGYAEAIDTTLRLVRDPARKAYARWAEGLADLGITEETLARGYGIGYADAMESFRR